MNKKPSTNEYQPNQFLKIGGTSSLEVWEMFFSFVNVIK